MNCTKIRVTLLSLVLAACGQATAATPKAIFIIVDGIPADVIEKVSTPTLDEISAEGAYARAYVGGEIGGESESPTVSAVGYNSLLTGTWANKHNVYDNSVENPNYDYWDIFRIAKAHNPTLVTAIYSTWTDNRTKLLGDGLEQAGGRKIDHQFDGYELDTDRFPHDLARNYIRNIDVHVIDSAAKNIAEFGPDLSWVYLEYPDDVGHYFGDSSEQVAAVQFIDEQLGKIWAAVSARQQSENEDWLLIVTTDHGRDADTGRHHGDQSERERTIWIVTNSNRLNSRFSDMPGIVDILPSIATHMELTIPDEVRAQLDGVSFID